MELQKKRIHFRAPIIELSVVDLQIPQYLKGPASMLIHESSDIDTQRVGEITSLERRDGTALAGDAGSEGSWGDRTPRLAASGGLSKGGPPRLLMGIVGACLPTN